MSEAYELRPATEHDFAFLFRLVRTTMREYAEPIWGWDDGAQELRFGEGFEPAAWQIICVDGRSVGGLSVEPHEDELFLGSLYLMPPVQGKGIGSAIVRAVQQEASKLGFTVELSVLITNVRARRLYERLGFVCEDETGPRLPMRWDCRVVKGRGKRV